MKRLLVLLLVLGIALPVFIGTLIPPPVSRNDMPGGSYRSEGIFNPRPTVYGLLDPETTPDGVTYQPTTSHATLTFPYIANLGRFADVTMRLSSRNLPEGAGDAPPVQISLNGHPYPAFDVSSTFGEYNFSLDTQAVPNPYLNPAHIQLDIQSTADSQSPDKEVGVAIDWIELQPRRSMVEIALSVLAWVSGLAVIMAIALSRLSQTWALRYGYAALATFVVVSLTYTVRAFPPYVEIWLVGLAWVAAVWLAPPNRPAWGFALVGLCLWVVLAGRLLRDWEMDDAYISYRYAWNLAHGHGLVYNPGEVVEGYTNFLWTLVAGLAIAVGFHPAGIMLALTIALSIGLVALTYYLGSRLAEDAGEQGAQLWGLLSAGILAIDASFITYGARGSGIEALPFAFLTLAAFALILWPHNPEPANGRGQSSFPIHLIAGGVLLALASLTRPEGVALAIILICVKAWSAWRVSQPDTEQRWRRVLRLVLIPIGVPYLLIVIPYHTWRLSFYGYPFPNTFYAKTGTSLTFLQRGWDYTWQFVVDHWFLALMMMLATIGLVFMAVRRLMIRGRRTTDDGRWTMDDERWKTDVIVAMAITLLLYTLYIIVVGGDHFPAGRFFVPLLAPLILLTQEVARRGLARLPSGRTRALGTGVLALGLAVYVFSSLALQDAQGTLARRTNRDTNFVNIWGSSGLWLRDHTPDEALAASPVAGAIAYYSRRKVVDILGLNDLHIGHVQVPNMGVGLAGHEKHDPEYVLGRKPQYIMRYPDYFTPVEDQLNTEYMTTTVRGPLGLDIIWWTRRDTAP